MRDIEFFEKNCDIQAKSTNFNENSMSSDFIMCCVFQAQNDGYKAVKQCFFVIFWSYDHKIIDKVLKDCIVFLSFYYKWLSN